MRCHCTYEQKEGRVALNSATRWETILLGPALIKTKQDNVSAVGITMAVVGFLAAISGVNLSAIEGGAMVSPAIIASVGYLVVIS